MFYVEHLGKDGIKTIHNAATEQEAERLAEQLRTEDTEAIRISATEQETERPVPYIGVNHHGGHQHHKFDKYALLMQAHVTRILGGPKGSGIDSDQ